MTRLKKILNSYTGSKEVKHTGAGDIINHPSHYTQGAIECIDAIKEATKGLFGIEAVCTANIIKYVWRWKFKNGLEDLDKASWYLERLKQEVRNNKK
jgi:hypothetical protein